MSSFLLLNHARQGVRATAVVPQSAISASLTRYDGGNGTALFRGTIPLPPTGPHAVADAAGLATKRVRVNGAEPAGGLWIEPLEYYHANGNLRSAYVEFQSSCGASETVACTVENAPRTVPDRTAVSNAVDRAPRAWHAAPTLFAITDPVYLCTSRVAPLPLVPLDHPNIPASVRTFLTTTFDAYNVANLGASTYDEQYALICRYLTTGDVAWLAEALERHQSENTPTARQRLPFSYWIGDPDVAWAGVDLNPANYAKTTGAPNGAAIETQNQSLTNLMVYALTGWEYGRIHVERNAAQQWFSDFRQTDAQLNTGLTLTGGTFGYHRQAMRWILLEGVLAYTLRMSRHYDVGGGLVFNQPGNPHGTQSLTIAERVSRVLNRMESYTATIVPGAGGVPSWWTPLIGVGRANLDDSIGRQPNFQFVTVASLWIAYLNGADTRASLPTHVDAVATFVRSQAVLNGARYTMPYSVTDPNALGTPENGTTSTVLGWLMAWEFARTGNTAARDLYDAVSRIENFSGETPSRKIFGELFYLAYHGAALRAGLNPLTWEVAP